MAKPGARAGLARALDELERAERNYEEPELATKAAASAAAAAVRLMRKRPNDSKAQQAGLEALVLATSVPSRVDAALDAGAAAVVQRAAARFCDVPRSPTSAGRSLSDSWRRRYSCPKNMMKTRRPSSRRRPRVARTRS